MIPVTALRHLYRLLSKTRQESRLELAKEFARKPSIVQALVQESSEHFSYYENPEEGFHRRPLEGLLPDQVASSLVSSHLLGKVVSGSCTVLNRPGLNFAFVDYEINPHRTTRSFYENGQSPRRGGMDLLLANRSDRFPIVGEVKVATDKDPFFALIQALMYSVEMTTDSQRTRLESVYGERLRFPASGPFVDLYLVLVGYPKDATRSKLLEATDRLGRKLLVPKSSVARLVRRIVCIETPSVEDDEVFFDVRFAHGISRSTV